MATVMREQTSDLADYPQKSVSEGTTIREIRQVFQHELDLRSSMIALVNGHPQNDGYRVKSSDRVYFKEAAKERGN